MSRIYFDNSATTPCLPAVAEVVNTVLLDTYGNPSSMHRVGIEAEKVLKNARRQVAEALQVESKEIFFTSGGTEANNWAIWGTAQQRKGRGKHIITSSIEHASVLESVSRLAEDGFRISYLDTDQDGLVDPSQLQELLTPETILVSVMSVNNEVGSIQPVNELARIIKSSTPQAFFHVDAVQSFGKLLLRPKETGIDMLSISAHKAHGPKGVGALYIDRNVQLKALLVGGEQEVLQRAGTENVPGIAGLGKAAALAGARLDSNDSTLAKLKQKLLQGLRGLNKVHINGPGGDAAAPHIVNIWCEGVNRGEVLLHSLEAEDIYVSTGSACHSRRNEASHVLKSMGLSGDALTGAIRVSLSYLNTPQEIDIFLAKLKQIAAELRGLSR